MKFRPAKERFGSPVFMWVTNSRRGMIIVTVIVAKFIFSYGVGCRKIYVLGEKDVEKKKMQIFE